MKLFVLRVDLHGAREYVVDDSQTDYDEFYETNFVGIRLPSNWQFPPHFEGDRKKPLRDFVYGEHQAPYLSERAKNALVSVVGTDVQFVPIGKIDDHNYWALNAVRVLDCLDRRNSDIQYSSDDSQKICTIWNFAFDAERIPDDVRVFKVPENLTHVFVTHHFVDAVVQNGISGVTFETPDNLGVSGINHAVPGLPIRQ